MSDAHLHSLECRSVGSSACLRGRLAKSRTMPDHGEADRATNGSLGGGGEACGCCRRSCIPSPGRADISSGHHHVVYLIMTTLRVD
jgi:hypothetical protein